MLGLKLNIKPIGGISSQSVGEYYPYVVYAKGKPPLHMWFVIGPNMNKMQRKNGFIRSINAESFARKLKRLWNKQL